MKNYLNVAAVVAVAVLVAGTVIGDQQSTADALALHVLAVEELQQNLDDADAVLTDVGAQLSGIDPSEYNIATQTALHFVASKLFTGPDGIAGTVWDWGADGIGNTADDFQYCDDEISGEGVLDSISTTEIEELLLEAGDAFVLGDFATADALISDANAAIRVQMAMLDLCNTYIDAGLVEWNKMAPATTTAVIYEPESVQSSHPAFN